MSTENHLIGCLPLSNCDGDNVEQSCLSRLEESIIQTFTDKGFPLLRYTTVHLVNQEEKVVPSFSINLSTFPEVWDQLYEDESYAMLDPVFSILLNQNGDDRIHYGSWLQLEEKALSDPSYFNLPAESVNANGRLKVYEHAEEYGLKTVLYVLLADGDSRSIILLANDGDPAETDAQLDEDFWRTLLGCIVHINFTIESTSNCMLCDKHLRIAGGERVVINKQQIQILKAYLEQPTLTAKLVAEKINLAETTVNYHLKEIRKKFCMPKMSGYVLAEFAKKHKIL